MTRLLTALVLMTTVARADVADPGDIECGRKSEGAACEFGACVKTTCSRTRPGPDGPQTSSWECMRCDPTATPSGSRLRIAIGLGVAVVLIGGGVLLARKRMKAER